MSLDRAVGQFDGGARSFPIANDAAMEETYGYDPPNEDYETLFFRQASLSHSQRSASCPRSAGWLVPDDTSVCKPVFVAHSVLAALWLLRETLPDHTLPDDGWSRLVYAAESLTEEPEQVPPSGQGPSVAAWSQPQRRRALSLESPPSKSPRLETNASPALTPEVLGHLRTTTPTPSGARDDTPALVVTTTNHNRRAERARTLKLEALRLQNRCALGLKAPSDKAPRHEHAAYASIVSSDESLIAWIIKQPVSQGINLYSAARTPYVTACSLVERARALGDQSARYHAAQFLHAWRERGSPFRGRGGPAGSQLKRAARSQPAGTPTPRDAADVAFCFAWDMCSRSEGELAAVHIEYRWAAALLGQAYENKMEQIRHDDRIASKDMSRNRYGKGRVDNEALQSLLQLVTQAPTDRDRLVMRRRLARAARWYTISLVLGWGSLALMPHDAIPNSWVEKTLRVGELAVWLEVVKRVNPDVYTASKALDSWLGPDGIAGGPIGGKRTLSIEAEAPATIYEVEDSEDEGEDEMWEDRLESRSPAQLRQLTLLELFHPVTLHS